MDAIFVEFVFFRLMLWVRDVAVTFEPDKSRQAVSSGVQSHHWRTAETPVTGNI